MPAIVLYTISFQAPGFYEKLGYRRFGTIDCDPPGTSRDLLREGDPLGGERGGAETERGWRDLEQLLCTWGGGPRGLPLTRGGERRVPTMAVYVGYAPIRGGGARRR